MDKHAYLIMAHNEPYIIEKLIKLIDDEKNDIFIHVDSKNSEIDLNNIKKICKNSNLYFTKRIDVRWGTSSQIECELLLLDEATKTGKYLYYHLLSGVDLPLKSQKHIHEFFEYNKGKEFVHYCYHYPIQERKSRIIERVKYYHFFMKNMRNSNKVKNFLSRLFHAILIKAQKLINLDRTKNKKYYYGANWFSITDDFARYIVNKQEEIMKEYKYTFCADEIFLQTIMKESEFYSRLYNKDSEKYDQIERYIDWERGRPYTFTINEYDELMNSNMLFARKFSALTDKKIIDKIYNELIKQ